MTTLHHVGLTVGDLEVSIAFYCAVLGCTVRERSRSSGPEVEALTGITDARIVTADLQLTDGGILELIQYLTPAAIPLVQRLNQAGHTHIAFLVDDVDAAHERLTEQGVVPTSRPVTVVEPGSAWDGVRAFYTCDPDGRTVECLTLRARSG